MPEEERLNLDVTVTDNFSEELGFLGSQLNLLDRKIRNTGGGGDDEIKIDVDVRAADEIAEVEALNQQIERLDDADANVDVDDDMDIDPSDDPFQSSGGGSSNIPSVGGNEFREQFIAATTGDGGETVADGDGDGDTRLFKLANVDDFEGPLGKFFDREALAAQGGETARIDDILNRDLDELVDFDRVARVAIRDDNNIDPDVANRLRGMEGIDDAMRAIDELNEFDPSITRLGGESEFQKRKRQFRETQFTVRRLHRIIAAFVPLMSVFIAAVPAAITAIGALAVAAVGAAGVLAGIGGLGALGLSMQESGDLSMEPLIEELKEVGASFKDAFAPLAQAMVPTLQVFLEELELMAGPLATASSALLDFRGMFEGFGAWLNQTLPSFTRDFLAFTDAVMPVVSGIIGSLGQIDWFGALANQLQRALPALTILGVALMDIIPAVINLSQGFLLVTAGIVGLVSLVAKLFNRFDRLAIVIGGLIGFYMALVTAATLYNIATTGSIAMANAWAASLASGVVGAIQATYVAIAGLISSLLGYTGVALKALTVTTLLVGVLTAGAAAVVGLSVAFGALKDMIGGTRKELAAFSNESLSDRGPQISQNGGMGAESNIYQDNSTTIIDADDRDSAIRQQEAQSFERRQNIDSIFGSGV